jgi:hypothetical protein
MRLRLGLGLAELSEPDPVNSVAPSITGTAQEGQTLTAHNGTWGNSPSSYTYQWKADGTNIGGATSSTYVLQAAQIGKVITVRVTATSPAGSANATSSATSAVVPIAPGNTVAPAVTGTEQQGNLLSTTNGTWSHSPTSYSYQWKRDGSAIGGATSSTYTLVSADVGHIIKCTVTATNAGGSGSADSNSTGSIVIAAPVNSVAPAVTGTEQQGNTLSTTNGTWSNSPSSYTYQWKRNGSSIGGATASTYALVSADVGATIKCTVTATNAGGSTAQDSNTTGAIVIAAPVNTVAPAVTGTAKTGQTLSTTNGTWSNSPSSYTYQWKAGGTNIGGATSSTFVVTDTQHGATITCQVTATNAGGSTAQISNATSACVYATPVNTVAPAVTGTETEGQTLSVTNGTWSPGSGVSYTYQWKRDGSNISSATNNTYVLVTADVGAVIKCTVTATNDGGATAQDSNSTGAIVASEIIALLMHANGTNGAQTFTDSAAGNKTITLLGTGSTPALDTGTKKFGSASMSCPGPFRGLQIAHHADFAFGAEKFTVEVQWKAQSDGWGKQHICGMWDLGSNFRCWQFYVDNSANKLGFALSTDGQSGTVHTMEATFDPNASQFYHFAFDFDGTTYRLYADGVVLGTWSTLYTIYDNASCKFSIFIETSVGAAGSQRSNSWHDEMRIVKKAAKFAGAFTPPAAEY